MPEDKKKKRKSLGQLLRGEPMMEGMEEAGKTLSEMLFNDIARERYGDFKYQAGQVNAYADPYEIEQTAAYMRKLKEVQDENPRSESGKTGSTRQRAYERYRNAASRAMTSARFNSPAYNDGQATPGDVGVRDDPQYQEIQRAKGRMGRPTY